MILYEQFILTEFQKYTGNTTKKRTKYKKHKDSRLLYK